MSLAVVARKDFRDAVRSKALWAVTALFVLLTAGLAYALTLLETGQSQLSTADYIFFLLQPASLVIPIAALMVGYKAIVGERESGSIKILLSLPHNRRDVVLGKVLGRATVVALATVLAFAVTAAVLLALYSAFSPGSYLLFVVLTLVFALSFTGLAVGMSAATASSSKATAGAFGLYFVFAFGFWNLIPFGINYLLNRSFFFESPMATPDWATFINMLNPTDAYGRVVTGFLPGEQANQFVGVEDAPLFISEWAALVVLLLWLAVPLLLGYWRFQRADL